MGKQNKKKKRQQQRQRQQEKEDELVGAALEAQVARLRKLRLSAEACGTEDQEHPNDDIQRAAACGFRVCDILEEVQREEFAAQAAQSVGDETAAAELRDYFDAPSSPEPSDKGSSSRAEDAASDRSSDEFFLAMHAPLERAERKRQDTQARHRDNGSKRRGQPAVRPDSTCRTASSSGFDALEVDSDDSGSSSEQQGVEVLADPLPDRAAEEEKEEDEEEESDIEVITTRDGQHIEVTGELIDAIIAIRAQASYLAPKKVTAKLKQQGFDTADLRRVVDAIWEDM